MSGRAMILVLAIISALAIATGCGSGTDSASSPQATAGSGSGATSSRGAAGFLAQANAACREAQEGGLAKVAFYVKVHGSDGLSAEALEKRAIKTVLLSTIAAEMNAIRRLGAEAGDEEELVPILGALKADFAQAKMKLGAKAIERSFADSSEKLRSYGLSKCAKFGE